LKAPFEAGGIEGVSITASSHRAGTIFLAAIAGNLLVFPDWPPFAAVGISLLWIGKGPLAHASYLIRRLIKLFVAFLFLWAFIRLIVWGLLWWLVSPLGLAAKRKRVAQDLSGSAPADIEAICAVARRFAFSRMGEARELTLLSLRDFENAVKRVRVQY
jgi:hypothetical protein